MYSVVPIRKIRVRYAVVGALIAAVLFELGKKLFSLYIIYFPSYQNIYGAIAIIPILLFWVYCSWIIIFIGVEIHATLQELYDKRINLKTQSVTEDDFDINE
jgi:membrane protein